MVGVILIQELLVTVTSAEKCIDHQSSLAFDPGSQLSCKDIHEKYPDTSGYYRVTNYCGMNYTGSSCEDIYNKNPETRIQPGFYLINNQWVFCNMTAITITNYQSTCAGVGGGWTRVGHFKVNAGDDCPSGWIKDNITNHLNTHSFCRPPGRNPKGHLCYSTRFSIPNGMSYTSVCGRAQGYQKGLVWGFRGGKRNRTLRTLNEAYVDGLSITHGNGEQRHHIWTYAVGWGEFPHRWGCPCNSDRAAQPPSYINDNYYCDSGSVEVPVTWVFFLRDPLWGLGCQEFTTTKFNKTCCSNEHQPWFYRNLGNSTADDIEARICMSRNSFEKGGVLIDELELYIQ